MNRPLSSIEVVSMDTETGTFKAKRSMVAMRKSIFGHCAGRAKQNIFLKYYQTGKLIC